MLICVTCEYDVGGNIDNRIMLLSLDQDKFYPTADIEKAIQKRIYDAINLDVNKHEYSWEFVSPQKLEIGR